MPITPITLFKCLSDETRLRCLVLLQTEGRLCVCELTHALDMLQPKISRHLALLRQSHLVLHSREGQWIYYQINPELPQWAVEILVCAVRQVHVQPRSQQDKQRLKAMSGEENSVQCCD